MKVAMGQMAPSTDCAQNKVLISALVAEAATAGADLIVLPEESMLLAGEVGSQLHAVVEDEWPRFTGRLSELSQEHGISIVAGGFRPGDGVRPFNTLVAFGADGSMLASYDKLHLYDAFSYRESDYIVPGSELPPVFDLLQFRVGLVNCYDIRFPEHSRSLVERGANVLAVPAAWLKGPRKEDHWETLVRARAIENTVWVVAVGSTSPDCIGNSMIVDPLGIVRARIGEETLMAAVSEITVERIDRVREKLPALANRRLRAVIEVEQ